jgi:hypothetical protein
MAFKWKNSANYLIICMTPGSNPSPSNNLRWPCARRSQHKTICVYSMFAFAIQAQKSCDDGWSPHREFHYLYILRGMTPNQPKKSRQNPQSTALLNKLYAVRSHLHRDFLHQMATRDEFRGYVHVDCLATEKRAMPKLLTLLIRLRTQFLDHSVKHTRVDNAD